MPYQNLSNLLDFSAKRHPRRIAVVFGQKKFSYAALSAITDRMAAGLAALGIKKHDKVAIFLDNCPEFIISYFAILKAQAICVPINYMFKIEEAKYIIEDSQSKALITSRAYASQAEELRLRVDSLEHVITTVKIKDDIIDFERLQEPTAEIINKDYKLADETAVILYTSGTTGRPKGAELTHRNLVSNALDCSQAIKVSRRDTLICILPLFHSFAATVCMNLPLAIGAKTVLMKSVRPFKRVVRAIRKNRVTVFVGIPSIYNILKEMKIPGVLRMSLVRLFNPVRLCISGAAALPAETLCKFEKKFHIPLLEGYGLTEASPVVTINPLKGKHKAGSIGIALAKHIKLKVVDEKHDTLDTDEIGELLVKGPNVMKGYFRQGAASREVLKDGWLCTGDMAKIDSEGYAYIVGRKKEMVNVRGLNVYPREIEEVLYQNPKIKEAAVIGVRDEHKGEVPKGFVVLKEGEQATEHEIIQYLRERLAGYKIPKHVEFRADLPKNTTGKILKRLLQDEEENKK
jgi:long-chain acyl-CoA synthetase